MLTLIKLESFKLVKKLKTWVVLLSFMLLTGLIAFGQYNDYVINNHEVSLSTQITIMQNSINKLTNDMNNIPSDIKNDEKKSQEYISQKSENLKNLQSRLTLLKRMQVDPNAWHDDLKETIKDLEETLSNTKDLQKDNIAMMTQQLEQYKYLLAHNIKPVEDNKFNAFNFINSYISEIGEVLLGLVLAVFASDIVSGESTPPTLKLWLTQPVTRGKVLLSKFISVSLIAFTLIISVELLAFLVVGLTCGFGDINYPMVAGAKYKFAHTSFVLIGGSYHFIPAWKYLIEVLLFQGLFILACTSFIFLISTLVKSSMVSMSITVISIIALTVIFQAVESLKKLGSYIFINYGVSPDIINGSFVTNLNNINATSSLAIIVLITWAIVCYIISHVVFIKKDILI